MRYLKSLIVLIQCMGMLQGQEPLAQQADFNIEFLSNRQIDFGENTDDQYKRYADIWGCTHDGIEYAILGTGIGTAIYNLQDPSSPSPIVLVPGASSRWRDYKSYGHYIYGVADEGRDGLLIIDMSNAPEDINWTLWTPSLSIAGEDAQVLERCHNLYIDSTYIYLAGCNLYGGGILIFDLAQDPLNPALTGFGDRKYAHDVYADGDRMYTSDLSQGFTIVDITDRQTPRAIVTQETSRDFTHNSWASSNRQYLFTTDERSGATIDAYDIQNPDEIKLIDQYRPSATLRNPVIPHNVHYYNGYLVVSYYTDGVKILDAHEPDNLVEVASYDTYTFRDDGFHGAWGAFPYLPSGLLLVSDIESGLYVLRPNYERASYIQGVVSDALTGMAISEVRIEIDSERPGLEQTSTEGNYKMGWSGEGTATMQFSKSGYASKAIEANLVRGQYTTVDVTLSPLATYRLAGTVVDNLTEGPISGAEIIAFNKDYEERVLTNSDGSFTLDIYEGIYTIAAGKWSFNHEFMISEIKRDTTNVLLRMDYGYRDDFAFDFGWSVQNSRGTSTSQGWQRGNPKYAIYNDEYANPNGDLPDDFGHECFITGLAGNLGANLSDTSILISPTFDLASYNEPFINYSIWFYDFGVSDGDDNLEVYLGDGQQEILIEEMNDSKSGWRTRSEIKVSDFLTPNSNMYLKIVAADQGNVHIYEAGIDAFSVTDGQTTAISNQAPRNTARIYPNPFSSIIQLESTNGSFDAVEIFDLYGKKIWSKNVSSVTRKSVDLDFLLPGLYFIHLKSKNISIAINKIIKSEG